MLLLNWISFVSYVNWTRQKKIVIKIFWCLQYCLFNFKPDNPNLNVFLCLVQDLNLCQISEKKNGDCLTAEMQL